jgi:hypothetical protein
VTYNGTIPANATFIGINGVCSDGAAPLFFLTFKLAENVTYCPYINVTSRMANGNPSDILTGGNRVKQFLSNVNATYCSVLTGPGTPVITYLINGSTATATYYPIVNPNGTVWFSFPCVQNTFYMVNFTPSVYAQNTTCGADAQVAQYFFLDEINETNDTANATVTIAFTVNSSTFVSSYAINNSQEFFVCKSAGIGTWSGNVLTVYSNSTSTTRANTLLLNNATNTVVNLYLLGTAFSSYYTFYVINEFNIAIPNATLQFYRFSIPLGAWVLSDMGVTDFSGYTSVSLRPFYTYYLSVSSPGYIPLNQTYTPSTVTSITIKLFINTSAINGTIPISGFETIWNDTFYSLTPVDFYHGNNTVNASFTIVGSNLTYWGMTLLREFNGTETTVFNSNQTGATGGYLNYTAAAPGNYRIVYWLKKTNYTEYGGVIRFYIAPNMTGLNFDPTTIVSPWTYWLIATICSMVAAGFASRYVGGDGASVVGLVIMWGFVAFAPCAPVVCLNGAYVPGSCISGSCIMPWQIGALTTIVVGAVLVARSGY